jgi:hypothetical protein
MNVLLKKEKKEKKKVYGVHNLLPMGAENFGPVSVPWLPKHSNF